MLGCCGRPQTESVVMLGCKNYQFEAGLTQSLDPLVGIEVNRIENFRRFRAIAPLTVGEGIHSEMKEGRQLEFLPLQLFCRRYKP